MRAFGLIAFESLPCFIEGFSILLCESGYIIPESGGSGVRENLARKAFLQSSQVVTDPWVASFLTDGLCLQVKTGTGET